MRFDGLIGGIAVLIAAVGLVAGLSLIAVGLSIWPPAALFLAAFVGLGVWQWQVAKRVQRARANLSEFDRVVVVDRSAWTNRARGPKPDVVFHDDDPGLPSSLD